MKERITKEDSNNPENHHSYPREDHQPAATIGQKKARLISLSNSTPFFKVCNPVSKTLCTFKSTKWIHIHTPLYILTQYFILNIPLPTGTKWLCQIGSNQLVKYDTQRIDISLNGGFLANEVFRRQIKLSASKGRITV